MPNPIVSVDPLIVSDGNGYGDARWIEHLRLF